MKLKILLLTLSLIPMIAHAEVYKWKDPDGKMIYSDKPPPKSNIQQEHQYGKKTKVPTGVLQLNSEDGDISSGLKKDESVPTVLKIRDDHLKKSDEVIEHSATGKKKVMKDTDVKTSETANQTDVDSKESLCKKARSVLANYSAGGRITKMNDAGEREFMGSNEIDQNKQEAQDNIDKNCQ